MLKEMINTIFFINEEQIEIDYNSIHNKMYDGYNLLLIRVFNKILKDMIEENSI